VKPILPWLGSPPNLRETYRTVSGICSFKRIKIGSAQNEEGKIFLESNSLAVLSEAASAERGRMCMDSVDKYLSSRYGIHLLWPAFSRPDDDIG
jgi:cellobiose phosphorylase